MTLIKATVECKTIIDFGGERCSRNHIVRSLRKCDVVAAKKGRRDNEVIVFNNEIKIGMYRVLLEFPLDSSPNWHHLKEYKDFRVKIYDDKLIDVENDDRFVGRSWVGKNVFGKLRIKHLIDIIEYCGRLHRLRAFS